jgi:protein required for attachment to host cells
MPIKKRVKLPKSVSALSHEGAKTTWILVAQRTKAKLMEHTGDGRQLTLIKGYVNPAGDLQTNELVSDRPGRVYNLSGGAHRHTAAASEDAHEHALTVFANDLATTVEKGIAKGSCDRVVLAAEPHCLGKIKKALSAKAKKRVSAVINKDLFLLDNSKLYAQLRNVLR